MLFLPTTGVNLRLLGIPVQPVYANLWEGAVPGELEPWEEARY